MATTAERLREAMALRGYKQADLAEKTGINKGALSCYISGKYNPKQNNVYLLAKALDVSEAWLMGADVSMDRDIVAKWAKQYLRQTDRQLDQEELLQELCELHGIDIHGDMDYLYITFQNGQKYAIDHEDWKFISMKFPRLFEDVISLIDKHPTLLTPID